MREKLTDIQNTSAVLLAVDPHDAGMARALLKDTGFTTDDVSFPLLMDPALTVSSEYGVTGQMRIHTEISNRPATFIIDDEGIIRFVHRAETFSDRPTADEVVNQLRRLQN